MSWIRGRAPAGYPRLPFLALNSLWYDERQLALSRLRLLSIVARRCAFFFALVMP